MIKISHLFSKIKIILTLNLRTYLSKKNENNHLCDQIKDHESNIIYYSYYEIIKTLIYIYISSTETRCKYQSFTIFKEDYSYKIQILNINLSKSISSLSTESSNFSKQQLSISNFESINHLCTSLMPAHKVKNIVDVNSNLKSCYSNIGV